MVTASLHKGPLSNESTPANWIFYKKMKLWYTWKLFPLRDFEKFNTITIWKVPENFNKRMIFQSEWHECIIHLPLPSTLYQPWTNTNFDANSANLMTTWKCTNNNSFYIQFPSSMNISRIVFFMIQYRYEKDTIDAIACWSTSP